MDRDPSIELIETMREQGKYFNVKEVFFGEVLSPPPSLRVKMDDIVLEKDDLYITQALLDRPNASEHSNYRFELSVGDKVIIIYTADMYIVLDKVVKV